MSPVSRIISKLKRSKAVLRKHGVKRLALFGSAANGTLRPGSDLDFIVEFRRPTFDAYMSVKEHLESRFGRNVDLVLRDAIKPALRSAILARSVNVPGI